MGSSTGSEYCDSEDISTGPVASPCACACVRARGVAAALERLGRSGFGTRGCVGRRPGQGARSSGAREGSTGAGQGRLVARPGRAAEEGGRREKEGRKRKREEKWKREKGKRRERGREKERDGAGFAAPTAAGRARAPVARDVRDEG